MATRIELFAQLLRLVQSRWRNGRPFIVFISGIDTAGKTTFAESFAEYSRHGGADVQVVHVDDFHNLRETRYAPLGTPPSQYFNQSFNIDMLRNKFLDHVRTTGAFEGALSLVDLQTDSYVSKTLSVRPSSLVIVEGVFLARSELIPYCDLFIQLDISLETAYARALARDVPEQGLGILDRYLSKYLPAQVRYIREYRPHSVADVVVNNEDPTKPAIVDNEASRRDSDQGMRRNEKAKQGLDGLDLPVSAVCFDFWDTLAPLSADIRKEAFDSTARLLGVDPADLAPVWKADRVKRESSQLADYLQSLAAELKIKLPSAVLKSILRERKNIHRRAVAKLRPDAEITLRILRQAGYKTALVSNCTSDLVEMIDESPISNLFDVKIFSSEHGLLKPDVRLFAHAITALELRNSYCIYIGDGSDNELYGARSAGMLPILLHIDKHVVGDFATIEKLSDVLYLVLD